MKHLRVKDKYQLVNRLGSGSFGQVYEGYDLQSRQEVALKLELEQIDPSQLENEIEIYKTLAGGPGIPRVFWHGYECEFRVMAFELLGPNLEDLFNYCGRRFSLKTVLMLADQLISRFQYIHSKGFIHRDIKPDNLLMGAEKQGNTVYVTDIGLAKEIETRDWHSYPVVGTVRYASINAHIGKEQSPRDDMESVGYVLIYFLRGSLPWQGLDAKPRTQGEKLILNMKQSAEDCGLFKSLPEEFKTFLNYLGSLHSNETPNYAYLHRLFRNLFRRKGFEYDHVFDWTELKFLECIEGKQGSDDG